MVLFEQGEIGFVLLSFDSVVGERDAQTDAGPVELQDVPVGKLAVLEIPAAVHGRSLDEAEYALDLAERQIAEVAAQEVKDWFFLPLAARGNGVGV